jgi:outer membrane lipase/esterase
MMRVIKILFIPIAVLFAACPAAAQPFTALWIFGDSTVDTGWYRTASSGEANYNYYMHNPALGVGKPTSGPGQVSVEVLATALGLTALPANQTNGTNYATGGARNVRQNTMPGDGFPGAVPTVKQIKNYLAANQSHASSTAFYVISSGDNDVAFALKHPGNKLYLQKAAYSLANEINALRQDGAKYILVVGLPQSFGSTSQKKTFRRIYNLKLRQKLNALGVPYLWGSMNRARKLMENYKSNPPGPFGITNYNLGSAACGTCSACPPPPNPDPNGQTAITTDWAYVCSTSVGAPSIPVNAATSEWADDNHYATGGQNVFGTYFYCAAQHKWPTLAWSSTPTLPFQCKRFSSIIP